MEGEVVDEVYRQRAVKRMEEIDGLPRAVRELVHEHGWTVIKAFLQCGVTEPRRIRHLITTVRGEQGAYGNGRRIGAKHLERPLGDQP